MHQILTRFIAILTALSVLFGSTLPLAAVNRGFCGSPDENIVIIRSGFATCYLIRGEEQSILVDTCGTDGREKVYNAVKDANVSLIVLTHGHYDHIQNAAWLANALGAKIAMSEADYAMINDQNAQQAYGRSLIQKISVFIARNGPGTVIDFFEPDFFLSDGQSVSGYGVDFSVIGLPGHTNGSIGIYIDDGNYLFAGDACMNLFILTEPLLFTDYDALLHSMDLVRNSQARIVFFGHGFPYYPSR